MIRGWHIVANGRGITALKPRKRTGNKFSLDRCSVRAERWRWRAESELRSYFAGRLISFTVPCDISAMTSFTRAVLRLTARIPYGEIRSYTWIAEQLGKPRAARAVGNALARNPVPIIIPCHRVVRWDGVIGSFLFGSEEKKKLLNLEKQFGISVTSRKSRRP